MTKLGAWTPGSLQGQPTWSGLKPPLWVVKGFLFYFILFYFIF